MSESAESRRDESAMSQLADSWRTESAGSESVGRPKEVGQHLVGILRPEQCQKETNLISVSILCISRRRTFDNDVDSHTKWLLSSPKS